MSQAKAADAIATWGEADREERDRKNAWNALSDDDRKGKNLTDTWTSIRVAARAILTSWRRECSGPPAAGGVGIPRSRPAAGSIRDTSGRRRDGTRFSPVQLNARGRRLPDRTDQRALDVVMAPLLTSAQISMTPASTFKPVFGGRRRVLATPRAFGPPGL
ncbi:hypothetical protein AB0I35_15455 [Nocardia sp. NPDC050378]|uniref:hypothetical protein n=1 Tax=Nocardia sp. NPDC050378 TaxID=3155400 RepID=UPI0033F8E8B1